MSESESVPPTSPVPPSRADYERLVHFAAPPETVFEALTTLSGLAAWWAPVTGSGAEGGELRFTFNDDPQRVFHVGTARRPSKVIWTVRSSAFAPMREWVGTTLSFTLSRSDTGGCDLAFRHQGLTPQLHCYQQCSVGWDYVLSSLRHYVDSGQGTPLRRSPALALSDQTGS